MRFLSRSLLAVFLLSVTLALLGLAGHALWSAVQIRMAEPDRPRMASERAFAVRLAVIEPQTVVPVLETYGEVSARRSLELRLPVGGRIVDLAPGFEDGAQVAAGQLLMRLDDADASAARDIAEADLRRAEADLREALRAVDLAGEDLAAAAEQAALRLRALERQQDLAARGVGTDAAVETAELALSSSRQAVVSRRQAEAQAEARRDQAEAALARQRLTLAEAERRLADTELRAAFSGVLTEVSAIEGGLLASNERVARLIDPSALEASFRVSTAQFARLIDETGALLPAEVEILLEVEGTPIATPGRLTRVGASVGDGQSGRLLHASLEAPRGFIPGDFVTLLVSEPALQQVAVLPASAVDARGTVLVVGADNRLAEAAVEVLRRQGDSVIVSAPGLEGAELVAERAPMLGAGILVRPIRPEGADTGGESDAADVATASGLIALTPERRAALLAIVEDRVDMPDAARARIVGQLSADRVPAALVARIEARAGG